MSNKFESDVIKALEKILKTETEYNVIIQVGKEPDFKEFHAHSIILRFRSEYFNEILSAENIEKKDGKYIIKKQNITPQAFDVILKFLYTGHISINNKSGTELLDIMTSSDELKLKQLTKFTEDFIIENYQQFLQNDPVGILQIINYNKSFVDLQEFCLEAICSDPKILFNSDKFIKLPAPLLEIVLKRDDLNLAEIEVWESLIKWGLAQGQTFNHDVTKWNQDDFNHLQRILYKFIPLIRFHEISSDDYVNKVKPYKKILSKELRDDILKFHMASGYTPIFKISPRCHKFQFDSVIITNQIQDYSVLFANWIDKKEANNKYAKTIPYKFNLLYRASRDGNTTKAFHDKCDNKGATIVIVKINGTEQIVGGYNPFDWDSSNNYKHTTDSFIFSFTDSKNINSAKSGYSSGTSSIGCYPQHGPIFGTNFYHVMDGTHWNIGNNNYINIGIPNKRIITDDYEVFQVMKK
ncbi:BTB/POZ domain-containing protein [Rhizophagus irregularis DAOM 181602=DAOM 197198]|uniref:Uncharacterized protein n=2 Tax=Rhizophagus irregularis TaxID=588596 RepID=U9U062_RHIID|nr:hypothetical protein GLOIN_2v1881106 [Rhizophagus irregularis DAOM 181602=DAOM 197198]EXX63748.1 hypothetical protein RirG_149510 [Rhizophagus irregularis DAOM 197198w]POG64733.1 hypothetical protein GLOIN_2v1881106 [Rhizophagus irregularis DAOM 181602=DAOM 197198]GBC17498.1 BTB/POZ domain-containing protein [Rhizophagus irregularis DAOM 181602=DAOM 197198]|eukprot:XP_025171599.1 hypothetical protein GLOIN_2v1881106 [Rhizophagus irregularis DAOM 181602=DAOM 197198]